MPKNRGLVIFDVDGTLIDSQHLIAAAMEAAYHARGLPAPGAPAVRRIIGLSLVDAVASLSPAEDRAEHLALAQAYKEAFVDLRKQPDHDEPLFPGARQAMDVLREAGWLLGVATGKSRRGLRNMIARHGLDDYFATLQTADDNPSKPHPAMLVRALAETEIGRENGVMVGDTSFDMMMACSAGVRGIGVAWGNHPPADLLRSGAEVVIEDFAGLPGCVVAPVEVLGCAHR